MNAEGFAEQVNAQLIELGLGPLDERTASRFEAYLSLFVLWNARINLSAVRDPGSIISRHLIESIAVARELPQSVATLLDFGSGGGLPGIPIALCRPEIAVTLAESQGKKAAFLEEAVRVLGMSAKVYPQRAETIGSAFDCVILRAVDKMAKAVASAALLVRSEGWLALMTTDAEAQSLQGATGAGFSWTEPIRLPGSKSRLLSLGQKTNFDRLSSSA